MWRAICEEELRAGTRDRCASGRRHGTGEAVSTVAGDQSALGERRGSGVMQKGRGKRSFKGIVDVLLIVDKTFSFPGGTRRSSKFATNSADSDRHGGAVDRDRARSR